MSYRQKINTLVYVTVLLFWVLPSKPSYAASSNASSLIGVINNFKKAYDILNLLEKIDKNDKEKLHVVCSYCKNILSCAELTGHLCSSQDEKNLNGLSSLLQEKNIQKIKDFVALIANEKRINCVLCEKFTTWIQS